MYCQSMETKITKESLFKAVDRIQSARKYAEVVVLIPTVELEALAQEYKRLRAFEGRMRELSKQPAPIYLRSSGERGWDYVTEAIAEELGEQ